MRWTSSVRDIVKSSVKTINGVLLNVLCYPNSVCVIRVSCRSALRSTGVWSLLNSTVRKKWNGGGAYKNSPAPCSYSRPGGVATLHLRPPPPGWKLSNTHLSQFKMFYLNIFWNVIYCCDGKAEFSASLPVFSVTWSFSVTKYPYTFREWTVTVDQYNAFSLNKSINFLYIYIYDKSVC